MSGTDLAFIRAYAGRTEISDRSGQQRSRLITVQDEVVPATVGDTLPLVSQYLTSATLPMPGKPGSSGLASNESEPKSRLRVDSAQPGTRPPAAYRVGLAGTRPQSNAFHRRDDGNPVGAPHLDASRFQSPEVTLEDLVVSQGLVESASESVTNTSLGIGSRVRAFADFRPQWEVDTFQLPFVCQRLIHDSSEGLGELFRSILVRAWRGRNLLAVTAFGSGEGVSTLTLCLAGMAVGFNARVAIVDGHFAHPMLAANLGVAAERGWNSLGSEQSISECAIGALNVPIVLIPFQPNSADAIESVEAIGPRVPGFLKSLCEAFDLVLLDAGPIFRAARTWFQPGLASVIHGAVVVRDVRHTKAAQLDDACWRLREAGLQEISVVENYESIGTSYSEANLSCTNDIGT